LCSKGIKDGGKKRKEGREKAKREGGRQAGTYLAVKVVVQGWVFEGVEARGDRADDV